MQAVGDFQKPMEPQLMVLGSTVYDNSYHVNHPLNSMPSGNHLVINSESAFQSKEFLFPQDKSGKSYNAIFSCNYHWNLEVVISTRLYMNGCIRIMSLLSNG